jgi:hypothetical protein
MGHSSDRLYHDRWHGRRENERRGRKRDYDDERGEYRSSSRHDSGVKAARMAKLAVWKANKAAQQPSSAVPDKVDTVDEDPLDAFMSSEILPEVKEKEERERREALEEKRKLEEAVKRGQIPKSLKELIEDADVEDRPDLEVAIPAKAVKRVIGPSGETIKGIEKKSGCRIQVKKSDRSMQLAFGSSFKDQVDAHASNTGKDGMVTLCIFGKEKHCQIAKQLIMEVVENKEEKAKQRARAYEKKKEDKRAQRQLYYLRHSKDYEALGVPLGTSKADVKVAFRKLALIWHPDKNPNNRDEAEARFQEISKAYDSLMATDEDREELQLKY